MATRVETHSLTKRAVSFSLGDILGVVIGSVVAINLAIFVFWTVLRKQSKKLEKDYEKHGSSSSLDVSAKKKSAEGLNPRLHNYYLKPRPSVAAPAPSPTSRSGRSASRNSTHPPATRPLPSHHPLNATSPTLPSPSPKSPYVRPRRPRRPVSYSTATMSMYSSSSATRSERGRIANTQPFAIDPSTPTPSWAPRLFEPPPVLVYRSSNETSRTPLQFRSGTGTVDVASPLSLQLRNLDDLPFDSMSLLSVAMSVGTNEGPVNGHLFDQPARLERAPSLPTRPLHIRRRTMSESHIERPLSIIAPSIIEVPTTGTCWMVFELFVPLRRTLKHAQDIKIGPIYYMSRRSHSTSPARDVKRPRLTALTPDDYRNGVVLAPMVRSGSLPTRLFALKHGAKLVWGPEIVDKAILHAERVVDPISGTISYNGKSKAMFTCHPLEKPYFIYQIGSSDPDLAVQAAKTVMQDVSGVELNCGCPKPFSTHAGMGAALLTNPDLLCSILTSLRRELPEHISVSAKIRLLPTQEDTLKLVERIVNTGVSCLTVHCRTRSMRPRERALQDRMKDIVDFVKGMGKDVAVIENGDCVGYEDARRIRAMTGADSVMVATAAEANPTIFSPTPLADLETTLIPSYIRLVRHSPTEQSKYLDNHWASTKFCVSQFKGTHVDTTKADGIAVRNAVVKARSYDDLDALIGPWTGADDFAAIAAAIDARATNPPILLPADAPVTPPVSLAAAAAMHYATTVTPPGWRGNPEPALVFDAPLLPAEGRVPVPAGVSGHDASTPTPAPKPVALEVM
ncbi:FMN-linked oxidoreductase [Artomyces pyxidatus]|uniref:FMN-linked oxidoreductase n=1 Tax=Artomyces pyxidatus TaxID=48021 RepID=A0ACB8T599_9AGAM|nr:FMN-linked oxidoreductase [Artomyces pyxidatus]